MDTRRRSIRILMLPWLAYGHISPFLELARALARKNFYSYICSTLVNLDSLKSKLSGQDLISIKLVELQLPDLPDLPPNLHTTNGLPPHLMPTLKEAMDMAKPSFHNLLETLKPDLVLYDFLQPWVPAMAKAQHVPSVLFLSPGAAAMCYIKHLLSDPKSDFPFPAIYYRDYEVYTFNCMMNGEASGIKGSDRFLDSIEQSSDIVLIKTFREIEGKYIDHLSLQTTKKIVPVGPLVQVPVIEGQEHAELVKWLNNKDRGSTVFVSFGSEYFLSREEMTEIALGLELSMVNFIWVVRFHLEEDISLDEALPKGFLERVGDKGLVLKRWAPQGRILGHSSVGGLVSHCGWSSVIESLIAGVPIIALPMHLDQPLNARLVEELGVGEEAVRNKQGSLQREEIERVIKKVVISSGGENFRRIVRVLSEKMRDKGEDYIDTVVEEMVKLCSRVQSYNSVDMLT